LCILVALLSTTIAVVIAAYDYGGSALNGTLLFFEAQRSGKLPDDQRVKWRADSGLSDGFAQGVDLVGGYYDAGDHVKFGLPMAFSTTILSWAAVDFRTELLSLDQLEYTLEAIKWGTDYFIRAHPHPDLLWAQVGDGDTDHRCWERPEDMTTPRTGYKLDPQSPGSDLVGETAAALAAASLAFRRHDSAYSAVLLVHARQLFSFADGFRGMYDVSIQSAKQFYASSGYQDELLWAATWLYLATNEEYYLRYVIDNSASFGGTETEATEFSWDDKYAGVQVLLSKVLLAEESRGSYTSELQKYKAKADHFSCTCLQKGGKTPGGLLYVQKWNNLQYTSSAAFLMAAYSGYLSEGKTAVVNCPDGRQLQPLDLLNFARSQADYILGKNPMSLSYLVGYGDHYPIRVHHRGASIPSTSVLRSAVGCAEGYEVWYGSSKGNPNVIFGGLVGGPDENDEFTDERSNYEQNEPTLSGTAPMVGLLSKLH
ncbi:hypothetical protein M569_09145, partial [Genlisea aurea]